MQVFGEKVAFVPVIPPLKRTTCKTMISFNRTKCTILSKLLDYELVMCKLDTMEYRERLSLVFAQLKTISKITLLQLI